MCRAFRRRDNGMNDGYSTVASRFLNSVSASCQPVGHSNEATKYDQRQFFPYGKDLELHHYFSLLHPMMNINSEFSFMQTVEQRYD